MPKTGGRCCSRWGPRGALREERGPELAGSPGTLSGCCSCESLCSHRGRGEPERSSPVKASKGERGRDQLALQTGDDEETNHMVSLLLESLLWQERGRMPSPYELVTPKPKLAMSTCLCAALGHWHHGHAQTSAQLQAQRPPHIPRYCCFLKPFIVFLLNALSASTWY